MSVLTTKRLTLRPFDIKDCDWVAEAMANIEVVRWIPMLPHPYGPDDAHAFVSFQSGPDGDALAVVHDGKGIGCITTLTELGYWFAQEAWGNGFATEAARAIAARHFAGGQDKLESGYILENKRSLGVLKKLGFVPTQTVQRHVTSLNAEVTVQRMVLTRQQWEAAQ